MSLPLHPADVLYSGGRPFPALAACEHYAGSEKLIRKALQLQSDWGPIFDITADCEDGAPAGHEGEHAKMVANLLLDPANRHGRMGVRIHDVTHPHWLDDLDIILANAGNHVAYVVFPKPGSADDVRTQLDTLEQAQLRYGIHKPIPVHILIETPGALHDVWQIASLPQVESIDFGLMDYVSAHHGAISGSAMRSPGQFSHPLIVRAKAEISAAALGNGIIPTHNVTTELRDMNVVREDAKRAREDFGFLRMWSIHPSQINPIIEAMRPSVDEVNEASAILIDAQDAQWGPISRHGKLHDRASYRYYWELLQRAHSTGVALPENVVTRFFNPV